MDNKEIALQIALTLIEKGNYVIPPDTSTMEEYGKAFAELYNAILNNLAE